MIPALEVLVIAVMVVMAMAGQHFAYQAGWHRAHADWHGWIAEGWRVYRRSGGDVFAAFGTGHPPPDTTTVASLYDWERDGI